MRGCVCVFVCFVVLRWCAHCDCDRLYVTQTTHGKVPIKRWGFKDAAAAYGDGNGKKVRIVSVMLRFLLFFCPARCAACVVRDCNPSSPHSRRVPASASALAHRPRPPRRPMRGTRSRRTAWTHTSKISTMHRWQRREAIRFRVRRAWPRGRRASRSSRQMWSHWRPRGACWAQPRGPGWTLATTRACKKCFILYTHLANICTNEHEINISNRSLMRVGRATKYASKSFVMNHRNAQIAKCM